jgi:hypothetical protein
MHPIAAQERTGMLSRGMTKGRIRVGSTPSQNGSTIDNQITRTDEPSTQSAQDAKHEECLGQRGASPLPAFPLL